MKINFSGFSAKAVQNAFTRRKEVHFEQTQLSKVLTTLDLTLLGVGSTLGVGVYVLAGDVSKNTAGPAITISFFIAAIASVFAGLCYAEFGARVPKAGSAYVYSYVCIGELFAFVIGWNLILEYLIGSATVTKALFLYVDELANNTMSNFFAENMPMHGAQLGTYVDLFSLCLAITFTVAIAFGAKESSLVNNVFTLVNLCVVITVIISGLWKVNSANWAIPKIQVPTNQCQCGMKTDCPCGTGGFAPYGVRGVIKGAARCFFAFIGFDCIATAGEEAKSPQRSIPIGVVVSLLIVFFSYFGVSTILTLILPYYEQSDTAPLPHIYDVLGWTALKYVVSVGAICALFSSLLGAMFPLPRIIYAMASDGLLFRPLSKVHPKFHTPFIGTLIAGLITGVLSSLLELNRLSNMMSIGTLLAYSMVAACVLILRYSDDNGDDKKNDKDTSITFKQYLSQSFTRNTRNPTKITSSFVSWAVFIYFCFSFLFGGLATIFEEELDNGEPWLIAVLLVLSAILLLILLSISFQPKSSAKLYFSVPLVPWIPGVSILINAYLMTTLPPDTWEIYAYWMIIGFVIYFSYGIWNSNEGKTKTKEIVNNNEAIK